jgi:hypothetical protein
VNGAKQRQIGLMATSAYFIYGQTARQRTGDAPSVTS